MHVCDPGNALVLPRCLLMLLALPTVRDLAAKSGSWFARSGAITCGDWTANQATLELDFASMYLFAWAPILFPVCMNMFSDMPCRCVDVYFDFSISFA